MSDWRPRLVYLICAVNVIALGLASRRYPDYLPVILAEYAGDTLWGLLVFLGISCLLPRMAIFHRATIATGFAFGVEFSQLYQAPWIDAVRSTALGGLILGFGFVWSDLACYAAGIWVGATMDSIFRRIHKTPVPCEP